MPAQPGRSPRRCISLIVVVLVLSSVALPLSLSTPVAADGMAQYSFDPAAIEATPGETFTVRLDLRSTPQFANGAKVVGVFVTFDETHLEAVSVEQGPFMSLHEETTVRVNRSEINNEDGYLIYELVRDPANGGSYGFATFAKITFTVKEDAPSGTSRLAVTRSRILLTDEMFQQVRQGEATVRITETGARAADHSSGGQEGKITPALTSTDTAGDRPISATDSQSNLSHGGIDSNIEPNGGVGTNALVPILAMLGAIGLFVGVVLLMRRHSPVVMTDETATASPSPATATPDVKTGMCPVCADEFDHPAAVRDHAWDAHSACHHCGAVFDSREELHGHWLTVHETDLNRLDARSARSTDGTVSTDRLLRRRGGRAVFERVNRRVMVSLVVLIVCVAAGAVFFGVNSGFDTVAGEGGTGAVASAPLDIGTPDAELGPAGVNVTRQSTTAVGQLGDVHWHATFTVLIDGQQVDFSDPAYMLRSQYVHVENGDGRTIHKHAMGLTLTDFFYTVDWLLTDDCLTTPNGAQYCSGEGSTLQVIINGTEIDAPASYELKDGDRIRIIYTSRDR